MRPRESRYSRLTSTPQDREPPRHRVGSPTRHLPRDGHETAPLPPLWNIATGKPLPQPAPGQRFRTGNSPRSLAEVAALEMHAVEALILALGVCVDSGQTEQQRRNALAGALGQAAR